MKKKIIKFLKIKKRNLVLGLFLIFKNFILFKIFKFDSWHIKSNYYLRPYKREAVEIINSFNFNNVIEIGCGLCEIISRVKCKNKIAIDIDKSIIKTCNYLYKGKISLYQGSLFDKNLEIINLKNKNFADNLLICINWPHNYNFNDLFNALKIFSEKYNITHLMIDLIIDNSKKHYKYSHTKNNLLRFGKILKSKDISNTRSLYLIKIYE